MKYLSLFTGVGGGDLAFQHLLGWECVGYVEWDQYCQRVIAQRIEDGIFDSAPIFGDVREFVQSGAAAEYRGVADVVTGGFPCQPFSAAGKRQGEDDPRNMWPATLDCIRTIRPRFTFLENVAGLLSSGYFGTILGDLAEGGYDARWRILSAAEVGAPHKRDRVWIVADAGSGDGEGRKLPHGYELQARNDGAANSPIATGAGRAALANATGGGTEPTQQPGQWRESVGSGQNVAHATGIGRTRAPDTAGKAGRPGTESVTWWKSEPGLGRLADGVADRTNRLKAIGNGIVPAVAATAWHLLTEAA